MKETKPEAAREKMTQLLIRYYGTPAESPRLEWEHVSLKEIAEELGYDNGYLSRLFNPPQGANETVISYQRVSNRLENLLTIQELNAKAQDQSGELEKTLTTVKTWRSIAVLTLVCLVAFVAWTFSQASENSLSDSQENVTTNHLRMAADEEAAILDLYHSFIQYRLAVEGIVFNEKVKSGRYDGDLESLTSDLGTRVNRVIDEARNHLRYSRLRHSSGIPLSTMMERISPNNAIGDNIGVLLPVLTDKEASSLAITDAVIQVVDAAQINNEKERRILIEESPLGRQCCYVLETEEQTESFLQMNGELNVYKMLYQAILLKDAVSKMRDFSEEERLEFTYKRIVNIVESVVTDNRQRYRNMGFITSAGRSVADIFNEEQPMETNIEGGKKVAALIVNNDVSLSEFTELLRSQIIGVQRESWERIKPAIMSENRLDER